jgi:hypothetical protein
VNVYRAAPLDPEKAAHIAEAFKRWGIDLTIPQQRPKLIQSQPADAPANDPSDASNG